MKRHVGNGHRPAAFALATALLAALVFTALPAQARSEASGGSIVYVRGGKLWVAAPDGRGKHRVPHGGSYVNPSQSDAGTIVAQRGLFFHRLNRRGRLLNKPITTAFRTSRILPAFQGPLWPEISPDGTKIAYTYSFTAAHYDPACNCSRVSPSLNTTYTWANRFTDNPERIFGLARFHSRASWIDNRQVLATTQHLFDYGGNVMDSVGVDPLGGGADSYRNWFSECVSGCDSVLTLQMYRLDEGEMTRQRDKLVFVSGPLGGMADGSRLLIYRNSGGPPAFPSTPCHVTGASGRFTSPTWSPDGRSLAWADARGIWVGDVGDISGSTCQLKRRLVIPGGTQPDWGPARP
jgi:WD40-like Beta Propeller Repeat